MTVDEARVRLRRKLEEAFGVEEATILMDTSLDLKLDSLEHRMQAQMANLASELRGEMRDQTWRLTTVVVATQGVVVAAFAAIGALLRFA
jgi:hypothetical protein